uniref:Uncharacterized protein LOC114336444 n=1 Tax=Diabrotica virgifera virgifera TaxID=50390 RepID=A0A6P7G170_DIAVI
MVNQEPTYLSRYKFVLAIFSIITANQQQYPHKLCLCLGRYTYGPYLGNKAVGKHYQGKKTVAAHTTLKSRTGSEQITLSWIQLLMHQKNGFYKIALDFSQLPRATSFTEIGILP